MEAGRDGEVFSFFFGGVIRLYKVNCKAGHKLKHKLVINVIFFLFLFFFSVCVSLLLSGQDFCLTSRIKKKKKTKAQPSINKLKEKEIKQNKKTP